MSVQEIDYVEKVSTLVPRGMRADGEEGVYVHAALLPNLAAGHVLSIMADQVVADSRRPEEVYYRLMSGEAWGRASTEVTGGVDIAKLPYAAGIYSYPHVTMVHALTKPKEIPALVEAMADQAPRLSKMIPDFKTSWTRLKRIPAWIETNDVPDTVHDVFWSDVVRTPDLISFREKVIETIEDATTAQITAARGEAWKTPHFSLAARPAQGSVTQPYIDGRLLSVTNPILVLGFMGSCGQLRGAFLNVTGRGGPTPPHAALMQANILMALDRR